MADAAPGTLGPLDAMAAAMTDGIVVLDDDWAFTYVNPRAAHILGRASDELIGREMWDVFPEGRGTEFAIAYNRAQLERTTVRVRQFYEPLKVWLDLSVYPLASGLALYFRDVSDEEIANQDAADEEKRVIAQAALLDVAHDAIVVRGLDHSIRYWNRAASELYGWSSDEVVGSSIRDLVYHDLEVFDAANTETLREGLWSGQTEQVTRSGSRIIVECSWTLVRGADGEPDSIFAVNTDVTRRRGEEERQLRVARMESLGTLAGGVAHDLNNVLTPILMSVQLLAHDEKDPRRSQLLSIMETSTKRGAEMIRQVLSFARGVEGRRIEVDLNQLLVELQLEARKSLADSISLTVTAPDGLWRTNGDPTQLLQVLVNLVNNARDAMPDGGSLVISARNVSVKESISSMTHLAPPGDYILIEVEDDGAGMSPHVVDRIFEPFFTTKGVGLGTGLGLATSAAILRSHDGLVQVYSDIGRGTRFRIHLPASREQPDTVVFDRDKQEADELPRGSGEFVLVVDDEAMIRQTVSQTLDAFGYQTAVASNGAEAMEFCNANPGVVQLVFTDMMMPIMDGSALAAGLHISHPEIRIVAASGLNTVGGIRAAADSGIHHFVAKPFTSGELLRGIQSALGTTA